MLLLNIVVYPQHEKNALCRLHAEKAQISLQRYHNTTIYHMAFLMVWLNSPSLPCELLYLLQQYDVINHILYGLYQIKPQALV